MIGLVVGMLESAVYVIDFSMAVVLVRGICVPYAGYGFLTGISAAKAEKAISRS